MQFEPNRHVYPVKGPLAAQVPLPTAKAIAEGITGNTGPLTMTLPNGEACSGQWSSAAPQQVSVTSGSLFTLYGPAAGYSVSAGNVPGVNRGEAFMSCDRGTTIQAEFYTGSGTANGYGVAKDSQTTFTKCCFDLPLVDRLFSPAEQAYRRSRNIKPQGAVGRDRVGNSKFSYLIGVAFLQTP